MSLLTLAALWISWLSEETRLDVAHSPIVSWSEQVAEKHHNRILVTSHYTLYNHLPDR